MTDKNQQNQESLIDSLVKMGMRYPQAFQVEQSVREELKSKGVPDRLISEITGKDEYAVGETLAGMGLGAVDWARPAGRILQKTGVLPQDYPLTPEERAQVLEEVYGGFSPKTEGIPFAASELLGGVPAFTGASALGRAGLGLAGRAGLSTVARIGQTLPAEMGAWGTGMAASEALEPGATPGQIATSGVIGAALPVAMPLLSKGFGLAGRALGERIPRIQNRKSNLENLQNEANRPVQEAVSNAGISPELDPNTGMVAQPGGFTPVSDAGLPNGIVTPRPRMLPGGRIAPLALPGGQSIPPMPPAPEIPFPAGMIGPEERAPLSVMQQHAMPDLGEPRIPTAWPPELGVQSPEWQPPALPNPLDRPAEIRTTEINLGKIFKERPYVDNASTVGQMAKKLEAPKVPAQTTIEDVVRPEEKDPYLSSFMKAEGNIDLLHEIRKAGGFNEGGAFKRTKFRDTGTTGLFSKNGLPPDGMVTYLKERNIIPDYYQINDLFDAVDEAVFRNAERMRGGPKALATMTRMGKNLGAAFQGEVGTGEGPFRINIGHDIPESEAELAPHPEDFKSGKIEPLEYLPRNPSLAETNAAKRAPAPLSEPRPKGHFIGGDDAEAIRSTDKIYDATYHEEGAGRTKVTQKTPIRNLSIEDAGSKGNAPALSFRSILGQKGYRPEIKDGNYLIMDKAGNLVENLGKDWNAAKKRMLEIPEQREKAEAVITNELVKSGDAAPSPAGQQESFPEFGKYTEPKGNRPILPEGDNDVPLSPSFVPKTGISGGRAFFDPVNVGKLNKWTEGMSGLFRYASAKVWSSPYRLMRSLEDRTGVRVWSAMVNTVRNTDREMRQLHMDEMKNEVDGFLDKYSNDDKEKIAKYIQNKKKIGAERLAQSFGMNREMVADAAKCQAVFKRWGNEFGIDPDKMFEDYIPMAEKIGRMKFNSPLERNKALWEAAKQFGLDKKFFAQYEGPEAQYRGIDWVGREWNIQELMHRYHWAALKAKYLAPKVNEYMEIVNAKRSFPRIAGKNPQSEFILPSEIRDSLTNFAQDITGIPPELDVKFERAIGGVLEKLGVNREQASGVTNTLMSTMYSSFLGLRPGPILRENVGLFLYGYPLIGTKGLVSGASRLATKEGWEFCRKAGLFVDPGLAGTSLGSQRGVLGGVKKVADFTLMPYKKANDIPRAVVLLGSHSNALDALKSTKNFSSFCDKMELDDALVNAYRPLYETGQFNKLATNYALDMVDSMAHSFWRANTMPITRNFVGRILGMFGSFSKQYLDFITNDVLMKNQELSPRMMGIRAKRMARFVGANAAIIGVGAELGIDLHNWVAAHPLGWFMHGSPALNTVRDMYDAIAGPDWKKEIAKGHLKKSPMDFVPAALEGKSVYQMATGEKDVNIPNVLGLTPYGGQGAPNPLEDTSGPLPVMGKFAQESVRMH